MNSPVADNVPNNSTEVLSGRIIFTSIGIPVSIFSKSPEIVIVIGDDLYQQVKNIKEYNFKNIGKHVLDKKNTYQIHSVKRKIIKQKIIKNT